MAPMPRSDPWSVALQNSMAPIPKTRKRGARTRRKLHKYAGPVADFSKNRGGGRSAGLGALHPPGNVDCLAKYRQMGHPSAREGETFPARVRPAELDAPHSRGSRSGWRAAGAGAALLLAGAAVVSMDASRGGGREGGVSALAESGWQSFLAGNATGNETQGGGIDGCPKLPACKKYVVNSLFWTFVNTLEILAVRDENGTEVSEPAGFIKAVPFSFTSDSTWSAPDGRIIASSHQDAATVCPPTPAPHHAPEGVVLFRGLEPCAADARDPGP